MIDFVAILDYNHLQSLDTVARTLALEPLGSKLSAFGWSVREVDGHNHEALLNALAGAPWEASRPSFLIAHTTKGKGVSFMENQIAWHYRSPSTEQLAQAIAEQESPNA